MQKRSKKKKKKKIFTALRVLPPRGRTRISSRRALSRIGVPPDAHRARARSYSIQKRKRGTRETSVARRANNWRVYRARRILPAVFVFGVTARAPFTLRRRITGHAARPRRSSRPSCALQQPTRQLRRKKTSLLPLSTEHKILASSRTR